jgi:catechol 2,3-dioxygenase-like lactoylglutathione lyase family enzyme
MQLHQAMLYVKDFERAVHFYEELLGLEANPDTRTDNWVEFPGLSLHAIPPHSADEIEIADPPEPREDYPVKLIFAVDNVEAEFERLGALGVEVQMRPWGACDVLDPEGNILQISLLPLAK